jgi:hypothetical protein
MKADAYKVLSECVERGTQAGLRNAFKHNDKPDHEYIVEKIHYYIMLEVCEYFNFDDNEVKVEEGVTEVSGLLPFTDVLELNICIEKLNTKQITLEEFVSDVWNTAYRVGYDMASEQ